MPRWNDSFSSKFYLRTVLVQNVALGMAHKRHGTLEWLLLPSLNFPFGRGHKRYMLHCYIEKAFPCLNVSLGFWIPSWTDTRSKHHSDYHERKESHKRRTTTK